MASRGDHRVYMSFMDRNGWQVQFLESDLKTPLPRKLHFASADKIIELVALYHGGRVGDGDDRSAEPTATDPVPQSLDAL